MQNTTKRTDKIRKILRKTYPTVKTQLRHQNPFELLVATILSAQCTDKQVNSVTQDLFKRLTTPDDFAKIPMQTLEQIIKHPLTDIGLEKFLADWNRSQ